MATSAGRLGEERLLSVCCPVSQLLGGTSRCPSWVPYKMVYHISGVDVGTGLETGEKHQTLPCKWSLFIYGRLDNRTRLAAQHNRLFPGGWSDECVSKLWTLHSNTMPGWTARKAAIWIRSSVPLGTWTWSRPIMCLFTSLDKPNSVKTPPNFMRFTLTAT